MTVKINTKNVSEETIDLIAKMPTFAEVQIAMAEAGIITEEVSRERRQAWFDTLRQIGPVDGHLMEYVEEGVLSDDQAHKFRLDLFHCTTVDEVSELNAKIHGYLQALADMGRDRETILEDSDGDGHEHTPRVLH